MRICAGILSLGLALFHPPASAQCAVDTSTARNADGSEMLLAVGHCDGDSTRTISVHYRGSALEPYRRVLDIGQDTAEAPLGGAALLDVDGDGEHEMELRGMCGAGPNCEGSIYRLNRDRADMFLFFSGGYARLAYIDGHLVESGRSSCCSWEHHVFRPHSAFEPVEESEMEYRVIVGMSIRADADDDTTCTFLDRQGRIVLPQSQDLLQLCEIYGADYVLAQPNALPR